MNPTLKATGHTVITMPSASKIVLLSNLDVIFFMPNLGVNYQEYAATTLKPIHAQKKM
jgi:hypothetical protein